MRIGPRLSSRGATLLSDGVRDVHRDSSDLRNLRMIVSLEFIEAASDLTAKERRLLKAALEEEKRQRGRRRVARRE